jgi:hypothetical protein
MSGSEFEDDGDHHDAIRPAMNEPHRPLVFTDVFIHHVDGSGGCFAIEGTGGIAIVSNRRCTPRLRNTANTESQQS